MLKQWQNEWKEHTVFVQIFYNRCGRQTLFIYIGFQNGLKALRHQWRIARALDKKTYRKKTKKAEKTHSLSAWIDVGSSRLPRNIKLLPSHSRRFMRTATRDLILGRRRTQHETCDALSGHSLFPRASQPKVLAMATDCSATCQQG